jgi:hypothetical protein
VTWMMDLSRSSLDGRNLGKWDACLGRIVWFLYSGSHCHMTRAQDLFESFSVSDSGMYMELGMETTHVVQGFETVVFHMESGDALRVTNVLWVPRVCSQPRRLRRRAMQFCSRMGRCYSCPEDLTQTQQWSWS